MRTRLISAAFLLVGLCGAVVQAQIPEQPSFRPATFGFANYRGHNAGRSAQITYGSLSQPSSGYSISSGTAVYGRGYSRPWLGCFSRRGHQEMQYYSGGYSSVSSDAYFSSGHTVPSTVINHFSSPGTFDGGQVHEESFDGGLISSENLPAPKSDIQKSRQPQQSQKAQPPAIPSMIKTPEPVKQPETFGPNQPGMSGGMGGMDGSGLSGGSSQITPPQPQPQPQPQVQQPKPQPVVPDPPAPAPAPVDFDDPFGDDDPPAPDPAPVDLDDPFGDDDPPAPAPAPVDLDDPFGADDDPPAPAPAPIDLDDPFGDDLDDAAPLDDIDVPPAQDDDIDPFGDSDDPAPIDGEDDDDFDPFG